MRDAFGGVANLVVIVVFLVLVTGYLAFNVNYTKAFRVKNKIVSTFEQYEGNCDNGNPNDKCNAQILEYMNQLGYDAPNLKIREYTCGSGYCFKPFPIDNTGQSNITDTKPKTYYRIVTQINIDIPIINKILPGLKIFQVAGDTKPIVNIST